MATDDPIPTGPGSPVDPAPTTDPGPDDESAEEVELDLSAIASLLADLSATGQLPDGVGDPEPVPFSAADVELQSNDWLRRIVEVQAWLCLDSPLPASDHPEDTATKLFNQISPEVAAAKCFRMSGFAELTDLGAQLLEARLNRALENRRAFEEFLDEGRSKQDSSDEWRLYWEEVGSQSRRPIDRITAKVDSWKIRAIKNLAEEGLLDLNPSYQRDIVWSNTESQLLIESVLRGIPLPSIILTQDAGSDKWQIVDGKQRLTAILRYIGHHPEGREFAKSKIGGVASLDKNMGKFIRKNHLRPRDLADNFMPFKLKKYSDPNDSLHLLSGRYYTDIKDAEIRVGDEKVRVGTLFESEGSDYLIPIILYKKTPIQDIHHVFSLYNKQGKKLNAEELRNAMYHHLDFTKLLLVLSGDRSENKASLAPYLPPDLEAGVPEIGRRLTEFGFGTARFKRTKVLNWTCAILFHGPSVKGNQVSTPSTAGHINSMLDAVGDTDEGAPHKLLQRPALVALAKDLRAAISAHTEADDAWSPKFRNKSKIPSRWEELPLVASLVGTTLAVLAGKAPGLAAKADALRQFTDRNRPPTKTQNKTQWEYIARVSTGILDILEVNDAELDVALREKYGYSCLPVLRRLAATSANPA